MTLSLHGSAVMAATEVPFAHGASRVAPFQPLAGLLDPSTRALVAHDGSMKFLTRKEFALLHYLCLREGATIERAEILREVWGVRHSGSNVVDTVVVALRRKLGAAAGRLQTVRGFGYRLQPREHARLAG